MNRNQYPWYEGNLSLWSNLWWTTVLTLRRQDLRSYAVVIQPDGFGQESSRLVAKPQDEFKRSEQEK